MNLLVLSQSTVTAINQQFFTKTARRTGRQLHLTIPRTRKTAYGTIDKVGRWPASTGQMTTGPVWFAGTVLLRLHRIAFIRLLRRVQPDLIYAHHEPYAAATVQVYLANWLSLKVPIGFYAAQNIRKCYPAPVELARKLVYRSSRFAFPVSQGDVDVLRPTVYPGPATVLPPGYDEGLFNTPQEPCAEASEFGIRAMPLVVGFLGRLTEEKALTTRLQAAAMLPHLKCEIVLAGEGPFREELLREVHRLGLAGRVRFVGYVPHEKASCFLSSIDVLVLPSRTRPNWKAQFGRILVEALACGTPVVGSNSGEIPNLTADTGGGIVFPEGSSRRLAEALERLFHNADERRTLGATDQARVRSQYTNRVLAARLADAISESL